MATIYLSLGTNVGDRWENLRKTAVFLSTLMDVAELSPIYETTPWGPIQDQPSFLNMCVMGTTTLSPSEFMKEAKLLEAIVGGDSPTRYGPRLIDIDLLFYDDLVTEIDGKFIPRKRIPEWAFVLIPLADIAPAFVHPELGVTVRELMAEVSAEGIVRCEESLGIDPRLVQPE